MVEVKLRLATLDVSLKLPPYPIHPDAFVEFAYLQIRKALELVALGSLVSNRDAYATAYTNFENARDARLIFRDLERINPNFYPLPVTEVENPEPGVRGHFDHYDKLYLTKAKFLRLYERCGSVLHTQNPHKARPNIPTLYAELGTHRDLITALLNVHVVQLANESNRYLIHMQEVDGHVHHYTLSPRKA